MWVPPSQKLAAQPHRYVETCIHVFFFLSFVLSFMLQRYLATTLSCAHGGVVLRVQTGRRSAPQPTRFLDCAPPPSRDSHRRRYAHTFLKYVLFHTNGNGVWLMSVYGVQLFRNMVRDRPLASMGLRKVAVEVVAELDARMASRPFKVLPIRILSFLQSLLTTHNHRRRCRN